MKASKVVEAVVTPYDKSQVIGGANQAENSQDKIILALAQHVMQHCSSLVQPLTKSDVSHGIWRGSRSTDLPYFVADTSKSERKSQNAPNYYTVLMDNSPHFSKYPKRSTSLICSTQKFRAGQYAQSKERLYLILPYDGTAVGVCPGEDIWDVVVNMSWLSRDPHPTYDRWHEPNYVDFPDLSNGLKDMGFPLDYQGMFNYCKTEFFRDIYKEYFPSASSPPENFMPQLVEAMKPDLTKFTLSTADKVFSGTNRREVWFSGKCVAISEPLVLSVINTIKRLA